MDLISLKAQAYDIIAQIEFLQSKLKETNEQIAQKINEDNGSRNAD